MNYYLSVDGGGTKTDFLLESEDRSVSVRLQSGAASIKSVGEDAVRQNISAGLNALWQRAGIRLEQVRHAVFGMSGCDCAQDEARLHKLLQSLGWKPEQYTLCNDAVLGFYAAADPPGLVLIAGTGSIVLGVDARGAVTRSGGWGYGFSDQGSGYWLGCRALEQALLYCDGCGPYAPWFEEVARALNTPLDQLPQTATALEGCDEVASLAALVLNWPEAEPLREEILTQGAAAPCAGRPVPAGVRGRMPAQHGLCRPGGKQPAGTAAGCPGARQRQRARVRRNAAGAESRHLICFYSRGSAGPGCFFVLPPLSAAIDRRIRACYA